MARKELIPDNNNVNDLGNILPYSSLEMIIALAACESPQAESSGQAVPRVLIHRNCEIISVLLIY